MISAFIGFINNLLGAISITLHVFSFLLLSPPSRGHFGSLSDVARN
jgi:hypothetical protein